MLNERQTRRHWLHSGAFGLGAIAATELLSKQQRSASVDAAELASSLSGEKRFLTGVPKAKRVICLFQAGGPSQLETWDHKPLLTERQGEQLPDTVRQGQRLTGMSGNQASLPLRK